MKPIRLWAVLWLLSNISGLYAQDGRYLKYQRVLQMPDDSAKCAQLIRYGTQADSVHDFDFALLIFKKANALLEKKAYPDLQLQLDYRWGLAYYDKGDYEAADRLYTRALASKLLDTSVILKARILNMAGANLQDLTVYKRALVYYNEALELYTKANNADGKGTVYQNMANIFALSGNLVQSDQFFDKALAIFLENKNIEKYGIVLGNKAYIKWKTGYADSAKVLLLQSLRLGPHLFKSFNTPIERYFNLGLIYGDLKRWDSCFYYLDRGKSIADSLHQGERFTGQYFYNLGYSYDSKGDYKNAIFNYKRALGIKDGIANYKFLYDNIAALYFKHKQYDSAFLYKNMGMQIADSIYKSELKEHITFENKRVELLEKDYQMQINAALQQQSLQALEKRNYVLVGLVVIMATVMLLLFLYFRQFRLRIKKEHLQSEIDFLKAQLNPHFLFNSINNIYVLLDENKEKASIILLKFSELMRYQLYECNVGLIHLSKELQFLENYTEFEKLRYSNKISVSYELSGTGSGNLLIAPLLLQPFIENAFKHTPKSRNDQSHIAVRISVSGNTLVFDVSNSRDATRASSLPGGIGLENVKKRLKLLYPGRHELSIKATNDLYHIILKLTLAHD